MNTLELCHVKTTSIRNELGAKPYPAEAKRYWLFTSKVCPFAHRNEIMRSLKGLENVIGLTIADAVQTEKGWNLGKPYQSLSSSPTPIEGVTRVPHLYEISSPDYSGRYSVPVLFDTQTCQIVNNESSEIIRYIDVAFEGKTGKSSFYPEDQRQDIDDFTDFLATSFIDPIYHAGFAQDQASYEKASTLVFDTLALLEQRFGDGRNYVMGQALTVADIHMFVQLCRFDSVYHSLYRLNQKFVGDCDNLSAYMGRLAEISAFRDSFDLEAMKTGYFLSWNQPTNAKFVPTGPRVHLKTGLAQTRSSYG